MLGSIVVFSACSKQADAPRPDDQRAADGSAADSARTGAGQAAAGEAGAGQAAAVEQAGSAESRAAASAGRITITAEPSRSPGRAGLARRCILGGDPLPADCVGGGEGIAYGKDGTLYVVADTVVRRYRRAEGDCRFEPSGAPIELPPDNPRPQKLGGGPVYMRSGGAAWQLVRAGDAVYAHDYLGGLFRIDRGKVEPACVDEFGYKSVAALGKRLLVARKGIEELKLGAKCKAAATKIDDKARGELYAIRGGLYRAAGAELVRYDGVTATKLGPATPVALGDGARICHIAAMAACGDGACVLDSNCKQVVQLAADGSVQRVLDDDKLFSARPWTVAELATSDTGDVLVLAKHRDTPGGPPTSAAARDKAICEAAIYELPSALFAQ